MENTQADHLWTFFAEYYDDWIADGQTGSLVIDARTIRVLSRMYGRETAQRSLRAWAETGDIHLFGDYEDLNADAPCVELRGYPSHVVHA